VAREVPRPQKQHAAEAAEHLPRRWEQEPQAQSAQVQSAQVQSAQVQSAQVQSAQVQSAQVLQRRAQTMQLEELKQEVRGRSALAPQGEKV